MMANFCWKRWEKKPHMTEIPKNAKNEEIVRITFVSFFKQAIVGSLWARLSAPAGVAARLGCVLWVNRAA